MKKCLFFIYFLMGISTVVKSQDLVVTLTSGNAESFAIEDIQSIKFGAESMILYELDGTVNEWDIVNVDNYAFDGLVNVEESVMVSYDDLNIYPNPTSGKVTLDYESNLSGKINIAVYDMNGRLVEEVFSGEHNDKTKLEWDAKQISGVQAGKYLFKITTQTKVITKAIVVQ